MRNFILLIPFFLTTSYFGQIINIEQKRLKNMEDGWKGNIDFNLKYTQNTKKIWQGSNKISLQYKRDKHLHLFLNSISLVRSDNSDLVNFGFAHYRYSMNLENSEFLKWESFAQTQYNSVQKIKNRTLLGTGLRFKIIHSDSLYLSYGFAFMYEYEETTIPEFSNVLRNSNYLSLNWNINKMWSFKTICYFQPNISDFADFRLSNESSLSHQLTKHISIVGNIKILYDSRPPEEVPVNVFNIGAMVRYKF